jgi:hypothetical protein
MDGLGQALAMVWRQTKGKGMKIEIAIEES